MSINNSIYGVDLSEKITPLQVRDAIVRCFSIAQEDLKKYVKENTDIAPEKIERFFVDYLIEKAFKDVGGDFHNPTKESLLQVVRQLQEHAIKAFRDSSIIQNHTEEIKQLIDKLE
jgi:hypothetical protein